MTSLPRRALLPLALPLAALLALVPDGSRLAPRAHGQKPMFPVLARLEMLNNPPPGGAVRVLASVQAWAPGEPVEWRLDVPAEVELVDGAVEWRGTLARGEVHSLELTLRVPDGRRHEITARAWLPERPRATSASTLPIDLGGYEGLRATEALVPGEGTTHVQYQGEVQPRETGR